ITMGVGPAIIAGIAAPVLCAGIGQGLPGLVDGTLASGKGAVKGSVSGAKKGINAGAKVIDWASERICDFIAGPVNNENTDTQKA
ncbi:MAG: hypothetical protein ACLFQV_12360, partial [Vulcanimicrobiota bacterium]